MPKFIARFGPVVEKITDFSRRDKKRFFLVAVLVIAAVSAGASLFLGPGVAGAFILAVLAAYLLWQQPQLVVLVLAVYTPFEPFLLKFAPDNFYVFARYTPEVLIYGLAAAILVKLLIKKLKYQATPLDLPVIFLLVSALTSILVNTAPLTYSILGLRQIIRFIILFFVVVQLKPSKEFIKKITAVMLVIVLVESLLGLVQAASLGKIDQFLIPSERHFFESIQLTSGTDQFWSPGSRIFATLGRYDQLGTFLSLFLIMVFVFYKLSPAQSLAKKTMLFLLALGGVALVLTLSRASWIGFVLGIFVVGILILKDRKLKLIFLGGVVVLAAYLFISSAYVKYVVDRPEQTIAERILEIFSFERWRGEYYGLGRLYWIVQTPLTVIPSSPLFGVGPGQYGGGAAAALQNSAVYEKLNLPFGVYGTDGYIDNNWFALWGELGTLGLIFYLWLIVKLLKMSLNNYHHSQDRFVKSLSLAYVGIIAAVSFEAFLGTYLEVRTVALYFWLYGAAVYSLGEQERLKIL